MPRLPHSITALTAALIALLPWPAAPGPAPRVAADIAPVAALVDMVMAGIGTAEVIVPPGASPHSHSMRPSEARALARAELVFRTGAGLAPWLDGPLATLAPQAHVVTLADAPGTRLLPLRSGADLSGRLEGRTDPHLWLDPQNAIAWIEAIRAALAHLDPPNAPVYAANADIARDRIALTEAEISVALAPVADRPFLVFHDSFQYFEARFGLRVAGAIQPGEASRPGPARLLALRQIVAEGHITCILAEPPVNTALIGAVFDTPPDIAEASPLGEALPQDADLYLALMRHIADALVPCLRPAP